MPFSTCKIHHCYTDESLQSNFPLSCLDVKLFNSVWSYLRDLRGPINPRTERDAGVSTMDAIMVDPRIKNKLHWKSVDGCDGLGSHHLATTSKALPVVCVGVCSDCLVPIPYCLLNSLSITLTDDCSLVPGSFSAPPPDPQLGSPHGDKEKRNGRGHPEMTDDTLPRRLE